MDSPKASANATLLALDNHHILFDPSLLTHPSPEWFEPEYWQRQHLLVKANSGRGSAFFIRNEHKHWVLRRYLRGGIVRHLLTDQYVFTGLHSCRSIHEFKLLQALEQRKLPVPRPVAAIVTRHGFYYQAGLIIETIDGAKDLFNRVQTQALSPQQWQRVGHCVKRFHNAGLYHHDLNIRNILIDEGDKVWLIDFDRCRLKSSNHWKSENLARLKRSFDKERLNTPSLHATDEDWQALLDGYRAQ